MALIVEIKVNYNTIIRRTAVRIDNYDLSEEVSTYELDDGTTLRHRYKDGAVKLAVKMLELYVVKEDYWNDGK